MEKIVIVFIIQIHGGTHETRIQKNTRIPTCAG